jgi:hypothetical protein
MAARTETELTTLSEGIIISRWKILGDRIVRSPIKDNLQESIGCLLKAKLHRYGLALSLWSEQIVRRMEILVNSYADAYRVRSIGLVELRMRFSMLNCSKGSLIFGETGMQQAGLILRRSVHE